MTRRLRLLDTYSCAGGAGEGYARAGFEVVGVDIDPQPNYPHEFIQGDAVQFIRDHGHEFDVIHGSPPCQRFSPMTARWGQDVVDSWINLIPATREAMISTGRPYVIENVEGARRELLDPIRLCGTSFGLGTDLDGERLQLRRHRYFESNMALLAPTHEKHAGRAVGVYGNPGGSSKRDGIRFASATGWREAMGVDWTSTKELAESIPPAYTEYLGLQIRAILEAEVTS